MTQNFKRGLITAIVVLILSIVYWSAYVSGALGWWWTFFGFVILFPLIYKLVDV